MKLQIKHIAAYVAYEPYGLNNLTKKMCVLQALTFSKWAANLENHSLILRHLSDLTKKIFINGERFCPYTYFKKQALYGDCKFTEYSDFEITYKDTLYYRDPLFCAEYKANGENVLYEFSYLDYQKLFELHFDVFGLIDRGLAIDINTLQNGR